MSVPEIRNTQDAEAREGELRRQIAEVLSTLKSVYKLAIFLPSKTYGELERSYGRLLKAYNGGEKYLKNGSGLLGPRRIQFREAFKELIECRRRLFAEIGEAQDHWLTLARQLGVLAEEYGRLPIIHHPLRMMTVLKAITEVYAILHEPAFMLITAEYDFKYASKMAAIALGLTKQAEEK